jgi:hypothetical protein
MRRWLVALIVALLLPCYGLAVAGKGLAMALADNHHAAAHLAEHAHHHHDDGSFEEDDSDEAVQHAHADDWLGCPALLLAAPALLALALPRASPPAMELIPPPSPFLEGLRRPPRSLAALS